MSADTMSDDDRLILEAVEKWLPPGCTNLPARQARHLPAP